MQSTSSRLAAISLSPHGILNLGQTPPQPKSREPSPAPSTRAVEVDKDEQGGGRERSESAKKERGGQEMSLENSGGGGSVSDSPGEDAIATTADDVETDGSQRFETPMEHASVGPTNTAYFESQDGESAEESNPPAVPSPAHVRVISSGGIVLQPVPASPPPSYAFATLSLDMVPQLHLLDQAPDQGIGPYAQPGQVDIGDTGGSTTPAAIATHNVEAGPSTPVHPAAAPAPPTPRPHAFSRDSRLELLPNSDSESDVEADGPVDISTAATTSHGSSSRRHARRPSSPSSIRSLIHILDRTAAYQSTAGLDEGGRPGLKEGFARDVVITRWRIVGGSKWNERAEEGERLKTKLGAFVGGCILAGASTCPDDWAAVYDCEITTRLVR